MINLQYFLILQFHAKFKKHSELTDKRLVSNTDADVALASNGKRPPHALHNISAI
jgi:hypothetical protein